MKIEEKLKIKKLEVEEEIQIEKRKIDNERLKDKENYKKEIKQIEKDHE